jgi:hypothetical protein
MRFYLFIFVVLGIEPRVSYVLGEHPLSYIPSPTFPACTAYYMQQLKD